MGGLRNLAITATALFSLATAHAQTRHGLPDTTRNGIGPIIGTIAEQDSSPVRGTVIIRKQGGKHYILRSVQQDSAGNFYYYGYNSATKEKKLLEAVSASKYELSDYLTQEEKQERPPLNSAQLRQANSLNSLHQGSQTLKLQEDERTASPTALIRQISVEGTAVHNQGAIQIGHENFSTVQPMFGSPYRQESLGSILDSPVFGEITVRRDPSAETEGLIATIKSEFRDITSESNSMNGFADFFQRGAYGKIGINDDVALKVSADKREPLWFIKNSIPPTKLIPSSTSGIAQLDAFEGDASASIIYVDDRQKIDDKIEGKRISYEQSSKHGMGVAFIKTDMPLMEGRKLELSGSFEEWATSSNMDLTEETGRTNANFGMATRAKNLNVAVTRKETAEKFLFSYTELSNHKKTILDDDIFVDYIFEDYVIKYGEGVPDSIRKVINEEYERLKGQKYPALLGALSRITERYRELNPQDSITITRLEEQRRDIIRRHDEFIDSRRNKSVSAYKVAYERAIYFMDFAGGQLLLQPAAGISQFEKKPAYIGGLSASYYAQLSRDILIEITPMYKHQETFFQRNNIEGLLKSYEYMKQKADSYSLESELKLEESFFERIRLRIYYKEYETSDGSSGIARGINGAISAQAEDFTTKLAFSYGKSLLDCKPYPGSIDATLSIISSYDIAKWLTASMRLNTQSGYWSEDILTNSRPVKLPKSINVDVGFAFHWPHITFTLSAKNLTGNMHKNTLFVQQTLSGVTYVAEPITGTAGVYIGF